MAPGRDVLASDRPLGHGPRSWFHFGLSVAEPVERTSETPEDPEAAPVEEGAVAAATPSASAGGSSGEQADEIIDQAERLPDVDSELTVTIIVRNMNNHSKL